LKVLAFQAERFSWRAFERTLNDANDADEPSEREVENAVVAFIHAEIADFEPDRRDSVFRGVLKHLKWLANKRELKTIVLHSFTHLGGATAEPALARAFFRELAERLASTGYAVHITPFGWMNAWQISVFGESLAKVFKAW
jgi:Archaea-specific editing domain of threonyl-tRNA synthetase